MKDEEIGRDEWSVYIVRANNGYQVLFNEGGGRSGKTWDVFQDSEEDELEAPEELLWAICEFFNLHGSRHDKERLVIRRERGDKYEEPGEEEIPI